MTPEILGKLEKAVAGAASKGSRDSLILMKNLAFIVNIPNRTVITAMDGENMKENVFTNIDSAVIAD
jgi:flagellar operon protein